MITVHSKVINTGNALKWVCGGTVAGYDYAFESPNLDDAQRQMRDLLKSKGYDPDDQNRIAWQVSYYRGLDKSETYALNKAEVLSKFRKDFLDGYYLYDVRTHAVVEMLIRGADPYEVIQQLLINHKELHDKLISSYK